ncbi:MAG: hypothetical protein M3Z64_03980 [Verrucomicrobiota bacterium]|nr:hypothetical protein [Verrucomicrobiota bacterium]
MNILFSTKHIVAKSLTVTFAIIAAASSARAADWVSAGPAPVINGGDEGITSPDGANPIAGAINSFAPSLTDANVLYVAAVNGGVWKTINAKAGSPMWTPLTDTALPSLSISAIALSPLDPNVVFAGSGRASSLANTGGKLFGIARSIDGGTNWTITGANVDGDVRSIVPTLAKEASGSQIVLALSASGVYRSADGGGSFTSVNSPLFTDSLTDLIADPASATRLYVGGGGKVFKSDDAGSTWSEVSTGAGFTVTAGARVLLAASNSTGVNAVYAAVIAGGQLSNVFRSVDQGANWTALGTPTPNIHPGKQGSSHGALVADPQNPNAVYISGDRQTDQTEDGSNGTNQFPNVLGANNYSASVWRNVSGTWENLAANGANGTAPHADTRSMRFDADGNVLQANDGGLFKLVNPNGTSPTDKSGNRKWFSLNGDLRNLESHNAIYDPVSKVFSCGAQDNGINTQRATGDKVWAQDTSGDGGRVEIDSDQKAHPGQSIRYDSAQNFGNFTRRTYDSANKEVERASVGLMITAGQGQGQGLKQFDKVLFLQPFILNQVDPKRMLIGTDYLYESMDRGDTLTNLGSVGAPPAAAKSEVRMSDTHDNMTLDPDARQSNVKFQQAAVDPDAPTNLQGVVGDDVNSGSAAMAYGGRLNGADVPDVFYVGSGKQIFHRVTLGAALTTLTTYPGDLVRVLVMDPFNYKRIFVLDNTGKIFTSADEGVTWSNVTANLASLSTDIRTLELFNPDQSFTKAVLYAGGLGGVWKMPNPSSSGTWATELSGLPPAVLIYDLRYEYSTNTLTAASLGRGVYALGALPGPSPSPTPTSTAASVGNISTRLPIGTGDNLLITGFIVTGPSGSAKKVLVRGIGTSLTQFFGDKALADPTLELRDSAGGILARNDNWKTTQVGGVITADQVADIQATGAAPKEDAESALIATVPPGAYTAQVRGAGDTTGIGIAEAYDLNVTSPAKLGNVSTRGAVQTGDNLMIGGFIVVSNPLKVIVRAIGPSLTAFGVAGAMADPTLELRNGNGTLILANDNWKDTQEAEIRATGVQPGNELESAIVQTLQVGPYTALVRGKNDTPGVGLVEVYTLP